MNAREWREAELESDPVARMFGATSTVVTRGRADRISFSAEDFAQAARDFTDAARICTAGWPTSDALAERFTRYAAMMEQAATE